MTQKTNPDVTNVSGKVASTKKTPSSMAIRIKSRSKDKIDAMIARVNKDRIGRRVKADDLICFGLNLLKEEHLEEIGTSLLSNKDKVEILFKKVSKEKRGITRDEFFGMLLDGQLSP